MSPRVIALLRVSTERQAEADRGGIPGQRRACEQIAQLHGLSIVDTVTLDGVSGVEVQRDPRFNRLLDRLRDPTIRGVVVADFDRLFRRGKWADFQILDAFADTGSVVYTSSGPIDPAEESGEWLAGVQGIMGGAERRRLLARTRRGKEEKRRKGFRAEGNGRSVGIPRGVRFDHASKQWSYVEPEASRVKEVFRLWLSGVASFREIARRVGLQRLDGTDRVDGGHSEMVRTLLLQPLYMGIYRVDRRWVKGRAIPRDPSEQYEVRVLDPPLIDPADWQRSQELLAARRSMRLPVRQRGDLGIYHGHAECALCGAALWMQPPGGRGGAAAYLCGNRRAGRCTALSVSVTLADPVIDTALEARLGDAVTLERLLTAAAAEAERRRAPTADIGRRLAELHNRRQRVLDGYEVGLLDRVEAGKRLAGIDGEVAALEEMLGRDDGPIRVGPDVVARVVGVFASWSRLTRDERRRLLEAYRIRVALRPTRKRRSPEVESVAIGLLDESSRDSVRIYKQIPSVLRATPRATA